MFTGLVEQVGVIQKVELSDGGRRFTVCADTMAKTLCEGDSIAVDGACMTVTHREEENFSFEASPESLSKTLLSRYEAGRRVNLERPLTPASRIGGHFVTGHVDGLGMLVDRATEGNSEILAFEAPGDLAALLLPKGSIAVMGVSLTINTVTDRRFTVAIIPYTLAHTNLGDLRPGDPVNLEGDLLGKYVQRLLSGAHSSTRPLEPEPCAAAETENVENAGITTAFSMDAPTLVPALDALMGAGGANIRTGGWFNHE